MADYARARLVDGHCVFLDEDKLCYLHKHFGAGAKPNICRAFPSTTITTSSGVFLTPTFACKGMVQALGRTTGQLEPVRDPPLSSSAGAAHLRVPKTAAIFADTRTKTSLTALAFDDLMRAIGSLMRLEAPSTEVRFLAVRLWLEDVFYGKRRLDRPDIRHAIQRTLADRGESLHKRVVALPTNAIVHVRILKMILERRLALGGIVSSSLLWLEGPFHRYALLGDSPEASARAFRDDLAEVYVPRQRDVAAVLSTYVGNKLFYNPRYFNHGVLPGVHAVIYFFALVRFLSVCRAAILGRPADDDLLLECIYTVEREFNHSAHLFDFWKDGSSVETQKLLFASVMLGG
jgi:hypothetical protein